MELTFPVPRHLPVSDGGEPMTRFTESVYESVLVLSGLRRTTMICNSTQSLYPAESEQSLSGKGRPIHDQHCAIGIYSHSFTVWLDPLHNANLAMKLYHWQLLPHKTGQQAGQSGSGSSSSLCFSQSAFFTSTMLSCKQ